MTEPVRVRFAPSPTGYLHIGSLKTAMYDWLLARHNGGSFILRIEDTDNNRKVEGAIEAIYDALAWMGLDWDEGPDVGGEYGPYIQSQRLPMYQEAAEKLIAQGDAYYCYCSSERLEQVRQEQAARKEPPGYDRHCRNLTAEQRAEYEAQGIKPVIRFKTPLEGELKYTDVIYGEVVFDTSNLNDFVMLKSDGYPTYHLANVVDDHAMKITHVIRADEWISSTPMHLLMYNAFGYEPPAYIHHPLILGPNRAKLSKRHGDVSVIAYREKGYLPEAMFNFLAFIGWSIDDKTEIASRQEIVDHFSLDRINKTGALFNREKLEWMNGLYIRNLDVADFAERCLPFLEKEIPTLSNYDKAYITGAVALVQERAKTLAEVPELVSFLFTEDIDYPAEDLIGKKMTAEDAMKALEASLVKLRDMEPFDSETMETQLRPMAEEIGLKAGQLFGTLRTATTGRTVAPPLFQTMEVIGKEKSISRIEQAIAKLK